MGDVAGIGPEVIARAWGASPLRELARPLVVGDPGTLQRALAMVGSSADIEIVTHPGQAEPVAGRIPCLNPATVDVSAVAPGRVDPRAGRAAYEYLIAAIDLALAGQIDAIVTLPLNKESLRAGGIGAPGHTEILAERCGAPRHAMMLYLPPAGDEGPDARRSVGLGVVHATLHVPLRNVFDLLTEESIHDAIMLADSGLRPLTAGRPPRVAVAGLNPHAGEGGLFGDEEVRVIAPAVERARAEGIDVSGPIAADTLFHRAIGGEFDAVVAMYHDQGHVALKSIGFDRAVNVTLGLPIVRTSVAHGTAFDIAWQGRADTSTESLISATRVAARLVSGQRRRSTGGRSAQGASRS